MLNKGRNKLKLLDLGIKPEAAVSGAVVLESEQTSYLTFNAMRISDGKYIPAGTAVVEFKRLMKSQFGYPNDEALRGHPLAGNGLYAYNIFEVENSSWLESIVEQNKTCFPRADRFGRDLRHFIFTFHDSTFECTAEDLTVTVREDVRGKVIAELVARIVR